MVQHGARETILTVRRYDRLSTDQNSLVNLFLNNRVINLTYKSVHLSGIGCSLRFFLSERYATAFKAVLLHARRDALQFIAEPARL